MLEAHATHDCGESILDFPLQLVDRFLIHLTHLPLRTSWHEPRIILNGFQALIHGEGIVKASPLAGVPHE